MEEKRCPDTSLLGVAAALCWSEHRAAPLRGREDRGGIVAQKSKGSLVRVMGTGWELKASWCGRVHELQR